MTYTTMCNGFIVSSYTEDARYQREDLLFSIRLDVSPSDLDNIMDIISDYDICIHSGDERVWDYYLKFLQGISVSDFQYVLNLLKLNGYYFENIIHYDEYNKEEFVKFSNQIKG